jgi:hypothetical protein
LEQLKGVFMRAITKKLYKRIINLSFAFVLTVSTLAATTPFIFSQQANAVSVPEIYVSQNDSSDTNDGLSQSTAVQTIQKGLDLTQGGVVHVDSGIYTGTTIVFKKSGTVLEGESKSSVILKPESSSGQAGVFANNVNNVTLENVTVNPGSSLTAGSIVKFTNGTNGRIQNVDVKASTAAHLTGIDINSFSNVVLYNIYVNGVGKDGISVASNYGGASANTSDDISMNYVSVSHAGYAGFAFYTVSGGVSTPLTGLTLNNISAQYNDNGIYFEGEVAGGLTTTGTSGAIVNLQNASFKDSNKYFIVNAQSKNIDAREASFGGIAATNLDAAGLQSVNAQIFDGRDPGGKGYVYLQDLNAPTLVTPSPYIANGTSKTLSWNAPTKGEVKNYEYAEYNTTAPTSDMTTPSWTKTITAKTTTDTAWQSDVTIYWRVRAIDVTGQAGPWSTFGQIITDRTLPIPSILAPSNGRHVNGIVAITTKDNEVNPSVNYITVTNDRTHASTTLLNDNTGIQNPTVQWDTTNYADGTYTIYYEAKDKAGNDNATTVNVTVDHMFPSVSINALITPTNNTTPKITGTYKSNDANSDTTVTLSIDGADGVDVTNNDDGTWSYTPTIALIEGNHTFIATATDTATNSGESNLVTITVDTTGPVLTVDPVSTYTDKPTFTGTVGADAISFVVTLNGETLNVIKTGDTTWSASVTSPLAKGSYTLIATASDFAGNPNTVKTPITVSTTTTPGTQNTPAVTTPLTTSGTTTTLGTPAVLGANTQNTDNATTIPTPDVKGASTQKTTDTTPAWTLAWYWWLLIIAGIIAAIAWITAAIRRRNQEQA